MGWGPNPIEEQAAARAKAEAEERAANRPLTPFERRLLGVIEDLRDAIAAPVPADGPLLVTIKSDTSVEVRHRLSRIIEQTHPGSLVTGENGPIVDARPLVAIRRPPAPEFDVLLDAPPANLGDAVSAGALALAEQAPMLREDFTAAGFEKLAKIVIEAALHNAASKTSPGQDVAEGNGAAGGDPLPPADTPTE